MDYDKLIEHLRRRGLGNGSALGHHSGLYEEAALTIKTLRDDLTRVTAERDAAIKDLNEFLSMDELCPIQCEWCKWNGTYCDGKTPEWRGIKED